MLAYLRIICRHGYSLPHTKFHKIYFSGSLVIDVKPRPKHGVHESVKLLFYFLQKNITILEAVYFLNIYYHT
jgi:hypothetical protein